MPQFTYTARDSNGGMLKGVLEGQSAAAIVSAI